MKYTAGAGKAAVELMSESLRSDDTTKSGAAQSVEEVRMLLCSPLGWVAVWKAMSSLEVQKIRNLHTYS